MDVLCCCCKKSKGKVDDTTKVSEPLLKSAAEDCDDGSMSFDSDYGAQPEDEAVISKQASNTRSEISKLASNPRSRSSIEGKIGSAGNIRIDSMIKKQGDLDEDLVPGEVQHSSTVQSVGNTRIDTMLLSVDDLDDLMAPHDLPGGG